MADELKVKVSAELNTDQLMKDLANLSNNKDFKIKVQLDVDNAIKDMSKALGGKKGDVQIKPTVDTSAIQSSMQSAFSGDWIDKSITKNFDTATNDVTSKLETSVRKIGQTISETQKLFYTNKFDTTLGKYTDEFELSGKSITTNLEAQTKEAERAAAELAKSKSYLSAENDKYRDIVSKAFLQTQPLTGKYKDATFDALKQYKQEILKLSTSGSPITSANKDYLLQLRASAERVIKEQHAAQYPPSLLANNLDTNIAKGSAEIEKYTQKLQNAGNYTDDLKRKFEGLRNDIEGLNDNNKYADWNQRLKQAKADADKQLASAQGIINKNAYDLNNKIASDQMQSINSMLSNQMIGEGQTTGITNLRTELQSLQQEYAQVQQQLSAGNLGADQFEQVKQHAAELDERLKQCQKTASVFNDKIKFDKASSGLEKLNSDFEIMQKRFASTAAEHPELKTMFDDFAAQLANADVSQLDELKAKMTAMQSAARNLRGDFEPLGQTIRDSFGGFGTYITSMFSAYRIIGYVRKAISSMVSDVKALDSSLVEFQKVSGMSGASLDSFTQQAYETGKQLGRTGKDVIDATTTFSRAGYDLNESNELAKAALVMTNIGADITSTADAASYMISFLQAYNIEAQDAMSVIDKLYNVSNLEPIDFGNIVEGLRTVGGTLAQSGTSIEESMALITGGFATLRDVSSVSSGLIMISQRLRGVSEDGEEVEGLVPKLEKEFKRFGISLRDQDGELRSTFDILNDLSGVWGNLSSMWKQKLGSDIAGTRQVKVLNALMQNWDKVQESVGLADTSDGTAAQGNKLFQESIQGHINMFQSAMQQLSATTIDSGFVKGFVDIGTALATAATNAGGLQNALLPILSGLTAMKWPTIAKGISKVFTNLTADGIRKFNWKGLLGGFVTGAVLAVGSYASEYQERSQKTAATAQSEYKEQASEVESLNSKLEETRNLLTQMDGKKLNIVEKEEKDQLEKQVILLERQLALEKALKDARQSSAYRSTGKAIDDWATGAPSTQELIASSQPEGVLGFVADAGYKVVNAFNGITGASAPKTREDFARLYMAKATEFAQTVSDNYVNYLNASTEEEKQAWAEVYYANTEKLREFETALDSMMTEASTIYGEMGKYENPVGAEQEAYNARYDFWMEEVPNAIIDAEAIVNGNKTAEWNKIQDQYADRLAEFSDFAVKKGQVTIDDIKNNYADLYDEFLKYNWADQDIVDVLSTLIPDTAVINPGYISQFDEICSKALTTSEAYETLTNAIDEQNSAGKLSVATYKSLIESNKDYAQFLERTADGYKLNVDAVNDYVKAQNSDALFSAYGRIVELQEAMQDTSLSNEDLFDMQNELTQLQMLVSELESASGAYARFMAAKDSADADSMYNATKSMYEDFSEWNKYGKTGFDDFQETVGYALGEDWESRIDSDFGGDRQKAYDAAEKKLKRYYDVDHESETVDRFVDDLEKNGFLNEDGSIVDGTTIEGIADKLGISADFAKALMGLTQTYNEGLEFYDTDLTAQQKQLGELQNAYNETSEAKAALEEKRLGMDEGTSEYDNATAQIEKYEETLATLQNQMDEISGYNDIQVAQAEEAPTMSLDEAMTEIEKLQSAISVLSGEGIEIPITLTGQYEELTQFLEQNYGVTPKTAPDELPDTVDVQVEAGDTSELTSDIEAAAGEATPEVTPDMSLEEVEAGIQDVGGQILDLSSRGIEIPVTLVGQYNEYLDLYNRLSGNTTYKMDVTSDSSQVGETENIIQRVDGILKDSDKSLDVRSDHSQVEESKTAIEDVKLSAADGATLEVKADTTQIDEAERRIQELQEKTNELTGETPQTPEEAYHELSPFFQLTPDGKPASANAQEVFDAYGITDDVIETVTVDAEAGDTSDLREGIEQAAEEIEPTVSYEIEEPEPTPTPAPTPSPEPTPTPTPTPAPIPTPAPVEVPVAAETSEFQTEIQEAAEESDPVVTVEADEIETPDTVEQKVVYDTEGVQSATEGLESHASFFFDVENDAELQGMISDLESASQQLQGAMSNMGSGDANAGASLASAAANYQAAYNSLAAATGMQSSVTINVTADTSSAQSAINSVQGKTVTITVITRNITQKNAKGTKFAKPGVSLVDEKGAELIEHVSRGTFEMGTNKGARFTTLDRGDVVHTAAETKTILSRAGGAISSIAGAFRNGWNQAKSVIGGAFATGVKGTLKRSTISSSSSKSSSKSKSSSSKRSSSSSTRSSDIKDYVEKLVDWVEVRIDSLKYIEERYEEAADEAIGFINKNKQLNDALDTTANLLIDAQAGYERYLEQAQVIAEKSKLSADIIEKIQDGTIDIEEYDETTRNNIKYYETWYNKAMDLYASLHEIREQQEELASQKLDNIIDQYEWIQDRLNAIVELNGTERDYKIAYGMELVADDYVKEIEATSKLVDEIRAERAELQSEFERMIDAGYIQEGSETWNDYVSEIENLDKLVVETQIDLRDLQDEASNINLTNLQYSMKALEQTQKSIENMMDLHEAQGLDNTVDDYQQLIDTGMEQIMNLRAQNAELRKQQEGLDVLSEKYQDLQDEIDSNNDSIADMMKSQEEWNDAVIDLKIDQIKEYKDQLSKTNDQYDRQKKLQESIEDLEKARTQRNIRVYREGVGFVYEADQEAIESAQEALEKTIHSETMSKLDDILDALEESKNDTNVYDALGNLLGSEYSLPSLASYAELLENYSSDNKVLSDAVKEVEKAAYNSVMSGVNNGAPVNSFQIGDINISGVEDVNALANAIADEFPNALLQAMHSKVF